MKQGLDGLELVRMMDVIAGKIAGDDDVQALSSLGYNTLESVRTGIRHLLDEHWGPDGDEANEARTLLVINSMVGYFLVSMQEGMRQVLRMEETESEIMRTCSGDSLVMLMWTMFMTLLKRTHAMVGTYPGFPTECNHSKGMEP